VSTANFDDSTFFAYLPQLCVVGRAIDGRYFLMICLFKSPGQLLLITAQEAQVIHDGKQIWEMQLRRMRDLRCENEGDGAGLRFFA